MANASVPLLGLVDTAVVGHSGEVVDLGAIALGALVFSFVYWGFGFLRMGTTGFVAQARGAGDEPEVRAALLRAATLGLGIGVTLTVLQLPIAYAAYGLLSGSPEVERISRAYFHVRIWGAPAALASFALMGALIGLAQSRLLLLVQLFLNGLNAALDVVFAGLLDLGAEGIALGTAVSEWCTFGLASFLVYRVLVARREDAQPLWPWSLVARRDRWMRTLSANADIMLRTLLMLLAFVGFTDQSARLGDTVLAANHILLQWISFSAYFLDGYAFVAESLVGAALGARDGSRFTQAVRRSTILAAASALGLSLLLLGLGDVATGMLTDLAPVREQAARYAPLAALYVLVAFAAFQLDGIFIGASWTRDMRNASAQAVAVFALVAWWWVGAAGNAGLWAAFIVYVIARAVTLGWRYPALRRSIV